MYPKIVWPENKAFAFTIFDDPDSQTFEGGKATYGFLQDHGFRTTKAVWPNLPTAVPSDHGITCGNNPDYESWLRELQTAGFEIAFHNATSHTSGREQTLAGLDRFAALFGHYPKSMANHYFSQESIYWNENRLTGIHRSIYTLLTHGRSRDTSHGHEENHPFFWGDACQQRIKYVRNFVFSEINTLKVCPSMPYHDPSRPYVNNWFASAEGSNVASFVGRISEKNQERLEVEHGACIMYVHFGHGFYEDATLNPRFCSLMQRLSERNGWFVPVSVLLDFLVSQGEPRILSDREKIRLERKWLVDKIRGSFASGGKNSNSASGR
jgi:hypothetical protein